MREHIPYAQLANLFKKYGKGLNLSQPVLYWASEPSDYGSKEGLEDRTYEDVHQLASEFAHYNPGITTSEFKKQGWLNFLKKNTIFG